MFRSALRPALYSLLLPHHFHHDAQKIPTIAALGHDLFFDLLPVEARKRIQTALIPGMQQPFLVPCFA